MAKLEDLLKALIKNGLKISPRKGQVIQNRITVYGKYYIHKR